ncbi:hypothetical protein [Gelria sp. Kuro-4]|uniref:hypothetical protein n=1 Tax=Gelria sp. Kuro-4 TaxID=2796927 RepID=UPI001BEDADD0|nr:hypothetical protein [Gelria sp. Kuro-4]BCV23282.1 hypothetical protein kuro4_00550 [Gelria sp. Kuro-4]
MAQEDRFPSELRIRLEEKGYFSLSPSERGRRSREAFTALRRDTKITVEAAMQYLAEAARH